MFSFFHNQAQWFNLPRCIIFLIIGIVAIALFMMLFPKAGGKPVVNPNSTYSDMSSTFFKKQAAGETQQPINVANFSEPDLLMKPARNDEWILAEQLLEAGASMYTVTDQGLTFVRVVFQSSVTGDSLNAEALKRVQTKVSQEGPRSWKKFRP